MGVILHKLLDDGHKGLRLRVLDLYDDGTTVLPLHHAEDGGLCLRGTPLRTLGFLAFVLVGLAATEIHLVALHLAVKRNGIVLRVEGANLVEEKPSGLLRGMDVTCKLEGGDTLLVGGNEVHCHEPLAQGEVAVLKDGSDLHGEGITAMAALEPFAVLSALIAVGASAIGAYDGFTPALLAEETAALDFGVEVGDEVDEGVELEKAEHIVSLFLLTIQIYRKKTRSPKNSPD